MKITLIENFRALFYIPFYAPVALGCYAREGVDVTIEPSTAAANTISALLAGEGDVSWGGLSRLMQGFASSLGRRPVAFCQVIARDPFFLIGREPKPNFRLQDLVSRRLAIVSEVPAPWMALQHDLRLAGVDAARIDLVEGGTMAEHADALRAGEVDVVQVFQPFAEDLVAEGAGHVWYAAAERGPAAYTTLNTTRDFAEAHPDTLVRMCRAVYESQRWLASHSAGEIASVMQQYFPDVSTKTLEASIDRYKKLGVWSNTPVVSRAGFDWIRDAALACGRVARRFEYDECVDVSFARQAVGERAGSAA
jgi:NitT/TauT family transport system substrate-binding protein